MTCLYARSEYYGIKVHQGNLEGEGNGKERGERKTKGINMAKMGREREWNIKIVTKQGKILLQSKCNEPSV